MPTTPRRTSATSSGAPSSATGWCTAPGPRGGRVVASFPVELADQIMLATSTGQSIRVPVDQISFRSRSAGGVRVFNVGADEEVVSVARVAEQGDEAEGGEAAES